MTRAEEIARKSAGIVVRAYLCCAEHSEYAHLVQEVSRLLLVDLESYAAEERAEIERLRRGLRSQAIAGTKCWFYAPCSKCGAIEGMGLTSPRTGFVAVWCCYCDYMGPAVEGISKTADRTAVQQWNAEFHEAFAARIREAGDPKSRTVGDGLHRTRAITAQKQNLP